MRYAHVAPSALRPAIDMLNPKTMLHANFGQPAGNTWRRRSGSKRSRSTPLKYAYFSPQIVIRPLPRRIIPTMRRGRDSNPIIKFVNSPNESAKQRLLASMKDICRNCELSNRDERQRQMKQAFIDFWATRGQHITTHVLLRN